MAGRPKIVFTDDTKAKITEYALNNCHVDTIAMALGIAKNTLIRHFGTFISQKRAEGRVILRVAQHQKAITGLDTGMLCFLGKNELGQADKIETTHGLSEATVSLLGLIDGKSKGKLPDKGEEDA